MAFLRVSQQEKTSVPKITAKNVGKMFMSKTFYKKAQGKRFFLVICFL
jgi:hypothetical protein